jgi:hypothetical protein
MAYRELGMVEIREVLRRWLTGDGLRAITRGTGLDRKTIAKYVRAAAAVGLQRGGPLPTDEQIAAVRHHACPPAVATPSEEQQALWPHRDTIQTWLGSDGLRLTKVARRLRRWAWRSPTAPSTGSSGPTATSAGPR